MSCGLMHVNGLAAECTRESCVYWSEAYRDTCPRCACALDRFMLLGPRRDRLAVWLLALKFKVESESRRFSA